MLFLFAIGGCSGLLLSVAEDVYESGGPQAAAVCEDGVYSFDERVLTDGCGLLPPIWFTEDTELRCTDDVHFQWTVADNWFDCTLTGRDFICVYTYEESLYDGTGTVNRYEEALEGRWESGGPQGSWRSETFHQRSNGVDGCLRLSEFEAWRS